MEGVNFELQRGEFVYLIGKVGSGKSSLLKTMYGELDITDGDAMILDYNLRKLRSKHVASLRRKLGIVFQDFQLLIDRNVYENLKFVLKATGWKKKAEIEERIREVLTLVGMESKGYKMPNELSGGEQQRIVIARAILNNPDIILADEPTGNLDVETGRKIVELLRQICSTGTAVIMTTHNLSLLKEYPGKVFRCDQHKLIEEETAVPTASPTAKVDHEVQPTNSVTPALSTVHPEAPLSQQTVPLSQAVPVAQSAVSVAPVVSDSQPVADDAQQVVSQS